MFSDNGIRRFVVFNTVAAVVFILLAAIRVRPTASAPTSSATYEELRDECGHTLKRPSGFFERHFDFKFLKKFFKHWIPFTRKARVKMEFFLYKKDFPDCGRVIDPNNDHTLEQSGFDANHQTRIIIHGWLSQSKGSLNRAVKNAYLSLTTSKDTQERQRINDTNSSGSYIDESNKETSSDDNNNSNNETNDDDDDFTSASSAGNVTDFNVIVVDWSVISSNVNYFGVVDMIEELGFLLAEFVRYLNMQTGLHYDDVYLIGHSLGAQIAGSAGKQIQPFQFNTIYALDPAGPKFRDTSDEYRIDPTDAKYVESIQTSSSLGFQDPVGHATFYPNYGHDQKKCYYYSCSHSRAHDYFAESITSSKGFWGTLCKRESENTWILSDSGAEFRMGGEPSTPKRGTFYVKTNDEPPYALGRRTRTSEMVEIEAEAEVEMEAVMS